LPLTQETLAQLIGVQRNANFDRRSCATAGGNYPLPGYIDITNAGGLKETAGECYGAVNAHHRRLLKIAH
jgi:hypothetical protein